ncbi:endonuclease domain-containing protein [Gryllotalpicola daejeonensis]
MDLRSVLNTELGFATRTRLREYGITKHELARALEQHRVMAIGRSLIAHRTADPEYVRAVRMGGRLACLTAAKKRKLWVIDDGRFHIAPRVLNSHFISDAEAPPVRVHRTRHRIDAAADLIPIESGRNMLMHVARCQPLEQAVVVFDSAVNQKLIQIEELRMLASVHGGPLAKVVPYVSGLADSGLESLTRLRLQRARIPCRQQVKIRGHRVDLLIGERLVVQLDGKQHLSDPKQLAMDREYDRFLRRLGYTVLRFSYADVVHNWDRTFGEITALIAQRAHLWP